MEKGGFYRESWCSSGSLIKSNLLSLVMDELAKSILNEAPLCILFADDVVFVDKNTDVLESKL